MFAPKEKFADCRTWEAAECRKRPSCLLIEAEHVMIIRRLLTRWPASEMSADPLYLITVRDLIGRWKDQRQTNTCGDSFGSHSLVTQLGKHLCRMDCLTSIFALNVLNVSTSA